MKITKMIAALSLACLIHTGLAGGKQTEDKEKFHIFITMGQSNMSGVRKLKLENADKKPIKNMYYISKNFKPAGIAKEDFKWEPAKHPINTGFSLDVPFAQAYLADHSDVEVGLVPAAMGGWHIGKFMPKGQHYKDLLQRAKFAMQFGEVKGLLWHQGESDTISLGRVNNYKKNLEKLMSSLRADLGLSDDVPLLVGNLGEYYGGHNDKFKNLGGSRKMSLSI